MFPKFLTVPLGVARISHVKFAETNFAKIRLTASHYELYLGLAFGEC